MTEYIEREAVLKAIHEEWDEVCNYDGCGIELANEMENVIYSVPAADVAPVKRGKWIKPRRSFCSPGGDPVWECDQCGKGVHVYGIEHGTYGRDVSDGQWVSCPNCGAKMDEEG